jgi:predicted signal transduction protein with EAL and GGDEF domain
LKLLSECGFPAARLEIEVTEDAWVLDFTMRAREKFPGGMPPIGGRAGM